MPKTIPRLDDLSRRERQIMDVVYKLGSATVMDVMQHLPDDLGNSTVRKQMNILEQKGYLRHEQSKRTNIYHPAIEPEKARKSATRHLLDTFFKGSISQAVVTLIDVAEADLPEKDLNIINELIEKAKREGR